MRERPKKKGRERAEIACRRAEKEGADTLFCLRVTTK